MYFSNQKGIAQVLVLILLLIGIGVGVYLVGQRTNIFPKATVSGPIIPETSFSLVTVKPDNLPSGVEFTVDLIIRSDIDAANLFVAKISFPPNGYQVTGIQKDSSTVKNWVEEYYDNNLGLISLAGGVPNPGYKTTAGSPGLILAKIIMKPIAFGTGDVQFLGDSAIYRNSDNLNILTTMRNLKLSTDSLASPIPSLSPSPSPSPSPTPTPSASTTPARNSGDGNGDNKANLVDMSVLFSRYGKSDNTGIDMNFDGLINAFDYSLLRELLIQTGVIRVRS